MENQGFLERLEESQIDLTKYWRAVLFNIYRIAGIFTIFIFLWLLYYISSPRIYQVNSLMQIEKSSARSMLSYEDVLFGGGININLEEQMELYKSRTNQLKLINDLQLNITFDDEMPKLQELDPVQVIKLEFNNPPESSVKLNIEVNQDSYNLSDEDNIILINKAQWNKDYDTDSFRINLTKNKSNTIAGASHTIRYQTPQNAIKAYLKSRLSLQQLVNTTSWGSEASLIQVTYLSDDTDLAKKILDRSNEIFLEDSVKSNSEEAKKSLTYVESQLLNVAKDLEEAESKINVFRIRNTTVDLEAESLGYLDQVQIIMKQIKELELKKAEYESIYLPSNPQLVRLTSQEKVLRKQLKEINNKIEDLPETQQEYINLLRNVQVNQSIYEDLLSRKLEFSLLEASTLGNVKIIDKAYVSEKVSPKGFQSLILFSILSIILGIIYAIVRQNYFMPYQVPTEVMEDFKGLKNLGILSSFEDTKELSESEKESLQTLVTNLLIQTTQKEESSSNNKASTVCIVGPSSKVGKSTISYYLAEFLSLRNKKTILFDMDYKRGDLHQLIDKKTIDLEDLFNGKFDLEKYKVSESFYLVPRPRKGSHLALSTIESDRFSELIDGLKKEFDYIVFDTPPILSLSDGISLGFRSDLIISVVAHNLTRPREVSQMIREFESSGLKLNNFVYNRFTKPKGYYGYDYYAYKYYGSYDYYKYDPND